MLSELQVMATALVAFGFLVISLFMLKKEHTDGRSWAARVGALFYSVIFGAFVGVVMVPLRMQMMDAGVAEMDDTTLLLRTLPTLAFFILVIRSDVTGRLPVIGTFIRAYRTAMLRRTIEGAGKRLKKIAALEERAAAGV